MAELNTLFKENDEIVRSFREYLDRINFQSLPLSPPPASASCPSDNMRPMSTPPVIRPRSQFTSVIRPPVHTQRLPAPVVSQNIASSPLPRPPPLVFQPIAPSSISPPASRVPRPMAPSSSPTPSPRVQRPSTPSSFIKIPPGGRHPETSPPRVNRPPSSLQTLPPRGFRQESPRSLSGSPPRVCRTPTPSLSAPPHTVRQPVAPGSPQMPSPTSQHNLVQPTFLPPTPKKSQSNNPPVRPYPPISTSRLPVPNAAARPLPPPLMKEPSPIAAVSPCVVKRTDLVPIRAPPPLAKVTSDGLVNSSVIPRADTPVLKTRPPPLMGPPKVASQSTPNRSLPQLATVVRPPQMPNTSPPMRAPSPLRHISPLRLISPVPRPAVSFPKKMETPADMKKLQLAPPISQPVVSSTTTSTATSASPPAHSSVPVATASKKNTTASKRKSNPDIPKDKPKPKRQRAKAVTPPETSAESPVPDHQNLKPMQDQETSTIKQNACPICWKSYDTKDRGLVVHLLQHLKRLRKVFHVSETSFTCVKCAEEFTESQLYQEHMVLHTREFIHRCPECTRRNFFNLNDLEVHLHKHLDSIEKKVQTMFAIKYSASKSKLPCYVCEEEMNSCDEVPHMIEHYCEFTVCPLCLVPLPASDALRGHLVDHLSNITALLGKHENSPDEVDAESGNIGELTELEECSVCSNRAQQSRGASAKKVYHKCGFCKKTFMSVKDTEAHLMKHSTMVKQTLDKVVSSRSEEKE